MSFLTDAEYAAIENRPQPAHVEGTWTVIGYDGPFPFRTSYFDEAMACARDAYLAEGTEDISITWTKAEPAEPVEVSIVDNALAEQEQS